MNDKSDPGIREWWASHPMTYAATHGTTEYRTRDGRLLNISLGSKEFFEKADQQFYDWNKPLHQNGKPFGKIFPYDAYKGCPVLEVGCGMGFMAMQWARAGAELTAVDLNPVAVAQTRRRFELFGLRGQIEEMDGRRLEFADNHFDFAYSWGVLHHSPDLKRSIEEIYRVLKPGKSVCMMLYHRHSLLYLYTVLLVEGFEHMEKEFLSDLELASRYGDGAREEGNPHTWPVTEAEVRKELFIPFDNIQVAVLGTDVGSVIDLAFPRWGSWLFPRALLKPLARRWGWGLCITATKPR
jgi:SAM-dependent methyltransferase